MSRCIDDPDFTLYNGDVKEVLAGLPDESVHCVVTSPPYWGLRDYGTGSWDGGDPDCDHRSPTMREGRNEDRAKLAGSEATNAAQLLLAHRTACGKCGAVKVDQQLGLEPTPDEYVQNMVAVFREVRRVLRRDGTCWLNIGDSYASQPKGNPGALSPGLTNNGRNAALANEHRTRSTIVGDLKQKDLVGVPWRVAFALQADGWYLRADIIWAKPNPMPESVTDRPTKAHEYVFLLTRSPRYFFDQEAVREAYTPDDRKVTSVQSGSGAIELRGASERERWAHTGRNVRSVWEIATQPYAQAHFATFPEALVERCVKAGSPEGGTILDPFMGSGTSALVARRLGRKAIGVELNPDYCALAARRLQQLSLLVT